MRARLRKLAELPREEWLLLPQLILCALLAGLSIRILHLPRLTKTLSLAADHRLLSWAPLGHGLVPIERLAVLVDLAARLSHGHGRCLVRSLLLFWLLKARGEPVALIIGVARDQARLDSHAWIEWRGSISFDQPQAVGRYATLLRS